MLESETNLVSLLLLGFFLGMRHATDADHIVAIATIVGRQRNLLGSVKIGLAWGVGHTITIVTVGGAIILFGLVIPARLGLSMELAVGVMLLLLGVLTLTGAGRVMQPGGLAHVHAHAHAGYVHTHGQSHDLEGHEHSRDGTSAAWFAPDTFVRWPLYQWLRPFFVGLVHGLAGSAAVALIVLSLVRDPAWAMSYLFLFGLGTIGGMMLVTLMISAPFVLTSFKLPRLNWQLQVASGLLSFVFGLFLIYNIGFADGGLFTDSPSWLPS